MQFKNLIIMLIGFLLLLAVFTWILKKDIHSLLAVFMTGLKKEFITKPGGICFFTLLCVAILGLCFVSESSLKYWYLLVFRGQETSLEFSKAEAYWGFIVVFVLNCIFLGILHSKK